eukprot:6838401-Lingulodinium_polyedra.AAC.1
MQTQHVVRPPQPDVPRLGGGHRAFLGARPLEDPGLRCHGAARDAEVPRAFAPHVLKELAAA